MADKDKAILIRMYRWQKEQFANDKLEKWMRDHAETVTDSGRKADVLAMANERKASNEKAIRIIETELERLLNG